MHLHCHREQSEQCAPLRPGCSVKMAAFGNEAVKGTVLSFLNQSSTSPL